MKIKRFLLIATAILSLSAPSYAEITARDVKNTLPEKLTHPYLYFTPEEKPLLLVRIQNDPECGDIMRRLVAEANRLLYTPVETTPPAQVSRPRSFETNQRLAYARTNTQHAYELAFVYQMTGDDRYARKAFEFIDVVCDLPSWVDRSHEFPIIYSRVWPWNVPDDQPAFGFDIETADTARKVAVIYDWLYPFLDKRQRDRIRGALLEKAITRVRGNYEYHWWATSYRCNWCPVCNAGLGAAALALLTEDPQLVDVIAESYNRITRQLDEIGVDGGWQEGCGYYRKGIHAMNFFADPLKRLSERKLDLYAHPRLADNPITFLLYNTVTPRRLLPLEDSAYYRAGTSHIWNKLAEETASGETAWFRDYMFGDGKDIFDIIWPRASVKPALPERTSLHFRTIDWAILRNSFTDPEDVVLACKAGMNDDPHHGHLDCGHFIVYWCDQEYISDSKSPDYDEFYFDETRWSYPQASSAGHNVVFVNGELQIPAKLKDQPWKEGIGGEILEFRDEEKRDYVLMDPSGAYPGKELKGWRRHITLEKPSTTVVLDEIRAKRGSEVEIRFHSDCSTDIRDKYVLIRGDKGMMALIPAVMGKFSFRTGKHRSLPIMKAAQYTEIPYFGTVLTTASDFTTTATVIVPVDTETDAESIAQSIKLAADGNGNLTLTFMQKSETCYYRYNAAQNVLVLE